jgi:hypothetical protein
MSEEKRSHAHTPSVISAGAHYWCNVSNRYFHKGEACGVEDHEKWASGSQTPKNKEGP